MLFVVSLALLIYALVSSQSPPVRVTVVILSLILGAAFLRREQRFEAPMLPLRLFSSNAFSGANLMTLLLYCALTGALYFLPFNLIQVQGYSAAQAGAVFLPFTLILGFGSTLAGDMIRKFDPRMILTVGPVVAAAGFMALAIPGANASYVSGFLPGILIIGVGMTLSVAPLTTVVMSSVGDSETGVASGVNNTAARIAGVLAVAVLTAVAVWQFSGALETRLKDSDVPSELVEQLMSNAAELAELKAPDGTPERTIAMVSGAVALAYVGTFRVLVIICGILAVLSGAIAWFSLAKD
jgi:predicted MFS family arabinose efflux permease